jgi:hypothetical protein
VPSGSILGFVGSAPLLHVRSLNLNDDDSDDDNDNDNNNNNINASVF